MTLFEILQKETPIFLINDIEDKKTKALIQIINEQLSNILKKLDDFKSFTSNQLEGEYNHKIIMAKSLSNHYENWSTIENACALLKKEETDQINKFNAEKNSLINNLKILLNDSQKFPVVSTFDVYDDTYIESKPGHTVIILGANNTIIIDKIIYDLEQNLVITGHYDEILPRDLIANYSNLESNVSECNNRIEELFSKSKGKYNKLTSLVENMKPIGEKLIFFASYKQEMITIGCNTKEIDLFEKDLLKKYIPLKKHLQKALKFEFIDICDISVNETDFINETDTSLVDDFDDFSFDLDDLGNDSNTNNE